MDFEKNTSPDTVAETSTTLFTPEKEEAVLVLEIVDLSNPDWGRYQWAAELFGQFPQKV